MNLFNRHSYNTGVPAEVVLVQPAVDAEVVEDDGANLIMGSTSITTVRG